MVEIKRATHADIKGLAKVHVDSWRTTYEGIVDEEFLNNLSYEEREQRWSQGISSNPPSIAVNETGRVIGFANGGKERFGKYPSYDGEVYAIYLLQSYQGKGIGRKLIHAVVKQLINDGYESMIIRVLEENESRHFYEALGGQVIGEEELTIGRKAHSEIIYGWSSLRMFL